MTSPTSEDHRHQSGAVHRRTEAEPVPGSPRTALRIGAAGAIGGGILALVGNVLHPRESGQLEDVEVFLAVAAGSALWVIDHVVILIAVSLFLGAFYGLSRSFTTRAAVTWAHLAWGTAIVGVVFSLALMITEATAVAAVADAWATGSGAERDLALSAGVALFELSLTLSIGGMLFLFGATPLLFGAAILAGDDYPSWIGWAGAIFASIALLAAAIQLLADETTLAQFMLFPVAAVGITFWIIYLGVLMWRRSREAGTGV